MASTGLLNMNTLNPNISATTRTVSGDELSSVQMEKITGKDSVMRQRAEASGKNYATSRGLLDSSIGAAATFGAFVDRAAPLAMANAERYGQVADQNLSYQNQFKMSDKNFAQQGLLQKDNQAWQTGERTGSQAFSAGENALDRTLQKDLQTGDQVWRSTESGKDRTFQTGEREGAQTFTAGQNTLDRSFQQTMQQLDQAWRTGENLADRIMTMSENEKNRVLEQYLQNSDQGFRAGENAADRLLTMSEAEKNRLLEQAMQQTDQTWRTGEATKDRDLTREQSAADRLLTMSESEKNRLLEQALQSSDQNWRTGENVADRILTMSEADKNRLLEQTLQTQDQNWRAGEAGKDRTQQSQLLDTQQGFAAEQNALDRTLTREEIASRERASVEQSKAEIEKLGYSLQLDQLQLNASTQSQIQMTLLQQIMAIQSDGNLDPGAKEGAITNAMTAATNMATTIANAMKTPVVPTASTFNSSRASEVLVDEASKLGFSTPSMQELNAALEYAKANNLNEQQMRAYVRDTIAANNAPAPAPTPVTAPATASTPAPAPAPTPAQVQAQTAAPEPAPAPANAGLLTPQPPEPEPTPAQQGSGNNLIDLAAQYGYSATPEEAAMVASMAAQRGVSAEQIVMEELRARGLA